MAGGQVPPVLRFLRHLAGAGPAEELADEQLLECFLSEGSAAAFAALVRRHGPMVLGVCRRVLRDVQDAEDAFQATFLVLVRKAGFLRQRELLGNWLYGVAFRTARKARSLAARRRKWEQPLADEPGGVGRPVPSAEPTADLVWRDVRAVLDEEVQRLPAKYRDPLVLCYLQGQTNQEAARRLNWPVGSVKGRLNRARELLRGRLARRGLALSAGALALNETAKAGAAVPGALTEATVQAGLLTAHRHCLPAGVVSPRVVRLTQGVLQTMSLNRLKMSAASLVALVLALTGLGWLLDPTRAADPNRGRQVAAKKAKAPKKKPVLDAEDDAGPYEREIRRQRSRNNMQFLGVAMWKFKDVHGIFPPVALYDANGKPLISWRVLILPYLGQKKLYEQFKLGEPWDSAHNKKLLAKMPDFYAPVARKPKQRYATYYQAITGKGTAFEGKKGMRLPQDFPDGTSNTILFVEAATAVPWTKPVDITYNPKKPLPKFGGMFQKGFHVTTADGGARFLERTISNKTIRAAITRNGGERMGDDWK
jgi:RNA polymerase sigma factor (sigma-70 family)